MRAVRLATCNLNQWAMDFQGNLARIRESIVEAKRRGARYRVGPELEVPGYGSEDHFFEMDTVEHSWECIAELLMGEETLGILCDIGMPVIHRGALYNCRVFILDRKIHLIRPKVALANDGNYRETRWFTSWKHPKHIEDHPLPLCITQATPGGGLPPGSSCPFGDGVLRLQDATLAAETCEELFTPRSPHIDLALSGVEIISNGSGSHHQLRKLDQRLDLIRGATAKAGGVYLYANQRGCDGGRLYFDGCACVAVNGQLVAQGSQFGLEDVEVIVATVDLDEVVSYRNAIGSFREQASTVTPHPAITVPFSLVPSSSTPSSSKPSGDNDDADSPAPWTSFPSTSAGGGEEEGGAAQGGRGSSLPRPLPFLLLSQPCPPKVPLPEEEIAYGPACWLWDFLRRSGASGFLLPLSGGADSAATAAIVGAMCQMATQAALTEGNEKVAADIRRIGQYGPQEAIPSASDLAHRIFATVYMGTVNSSKETRSRSKALAGQVGSYHTDLDIDHVVESLVALFQVVTGRRPAFRVDGGTPAENLALQNIQARIRMVVAFLFAQLTPWVRGRSGFLLVLGSANVDECLRGYLTKYDCSSADINPIGGISKTDLRRFLKWGAVHLGYPELANVEAAPPTAELEPLREGHKPQNDEDDMGMTYEELSVFGRLRKMSQCGPVSMYRRCLQLWHNTLPASSIATKVKNFFRFYAINRHKTTVLTPSYHAESYSPDDNRFDHRQFLYNVMWPWQFRKIDAEAARQK